MPCRRRESCRDRRMTGARAHRLEHGPAAADTFARWPACPCPISRRTRSCFIDAVRAFFTDRGLFFYQVYFQDEGPPEAELEADRPETDPQVLLCHLRRCAGRHMAGPTRSMATRLLHRLRSRPCPCPRCQARMSPIMTPSSASPAFAAAQPLPATGTANHAFLTGHAAPTTIAQPSLYIGGTRDPCPENVAWRHAGRDEGKPV